MNISGCENFEDDTSKNRIATSDTLIIYPWLVDLDSTLNSVEGSQAFESYLARFSSLTQLEFIWACDGMKTLVEENPDKCDQLVSCIYKNYIITGSLFNLSNQVVLNIAKRMENHFENPEQAFTYPQKTTTPERKNLDMRIFDEAKTEVETFLRTTIFPQFQKAVESGEVCVGKSKDNLSSGTDKSQSSLQPNKFARSKLASHPEAFVRALCEKLEGLQLTRKNN